MSQSTLLINLRDKNDVGIPLTYIRVSYASQNEDQAWIDGFTDFAGNVAFMKMEEGKYRAYVNTRNVNKKYASTEVEVDLPCGDVKIVLDRVKIQRVYKSGDDLLLGNGDRFTWAMGTNFMLAQLLADGEDIKSKFYPHVNGYRLFGMYDIIAKQAGRKTFSPRDYPNWLESIEKTIDSLAEDNLYCQLNLICDNQILNFTVDELRKLVDQVDEMAKNKDNLFFSLGNENFKNGFNADDFHEPGNMISACGSGGTGEPAPLCRGEAWDIQHQHLRRDIKMFIDIPPIDAPTYSKGHIIIFDETIGFANHDSGSRSSNADWAFKMGRIASAFNGITIHVESPIHSNYPNQTELNCLAAFEEGINV
jgi:hypothetical protein